MLEGQGTQYYEGGTQAMYSGGWKGGQPHGQGTYYDHDGRLVYEGMYVWCFGNRGGVARGNQGGVCGDLVVYLHAVLGLAAVLESTGVREEPITCMR